MDLNAFRKAAEAKDIDALARTLDPDIELCSHVMPKPYVGRDTVVPLLRILMTAFEDFRYTHELAGPSSNGALVDGGPPVQALVFSATVMGKSLQGLDLITFNSENLVANLTVMVRPLPASMTLARVVGKKIDEAAQQG